MTGNCLVSRRLCVYGESTKPAMTMAQLSSSTGQAWVSSDLSEWCMLTPVV